MALERSKDAVRKHPAGTTAGISGVLGGIIISYYNLDPQAAALVTSALGFLTATVSWVVAHGGVKGLLNDLFSGGAPADG